MRFLVWLTSLSVGGFTSFAATLDDLHQEISAVCPILGLSGDKKNPREIRIDFRPDASAEQKKAAFAIRNSFDHRKQGLAELDQQIDRLLAEAADRRSLDEASFGRVYISAQRAKLVRASEAKRRFVLEIEKMMNDAVNSMAHGN